MTGAKEVTLTPADPPKRRNAATILSERLALKQRELDLAQVDLDTATSVHAALQAEVNALTDAYELVNPKPRTRAKKSRKDNQ